MTTSVGVGMSQHRSTRIAGREAAERAFTAAGVSRADLVILYTTVGHDMAELLAVVREATGRAPLIGCSVSGCIGRGVVDQTSYCVEIAVIASDELRFHTAHVAEMSREPVAAGRSLGAALQPHLEGDAVALLLLADCFTLNYTAITQGIDEALLHGRALPILGGGSNNDITSYTTYQFCDDEVSTTGAVVALISGPATVVTAVTHGCYPLGMKQTVTRAEGNRILEIDHKPALAAIQQYVTGEEGDDWQTTVSNLSLGLETPESLVGEYDPLCIRYIVGRDVDAGAVIIQTDIAEGTPIWLTRRNPERICNEAERSAERLRERIGERTPKLVFHFECTGRGKLLLPEAARNQVIDRIQRATGEAIPWLGGYFGGELGPIAGTNMLHNYTAVVAALV